MTERNYVHYEFPQCVVPLGHVNGHFYWAKSSGRNRTQLFRSSSSMRLQRDSEALVQFDLPLHFFQSPAISRCKRFIYTVGPQYSGTNKRPNKQKEKLAFVVVDVPNLNANVFYTTGFHEVLSHYPPSLYCSATDIFLLTSYTITEQGNTLKSTHVPSIELTPEAKVHSTCIFRVILDRPTSTFELQYVAVPLRPVRPGRVILPTLSAASSRVNVVPVPDDLSFHVLSMDEGRIRIFTLNVDGVAHVFDGSSWRTLRPLDNDVEEIAKTRSDRSMEVKGSAMFSVHGRLMYLRRAVNSKCAVLYEVHVDWEASTFRFRKMCSRFTMPTCSSMVFSEGILAFTTFCCWTTDSRMPTKGFFRILFADVAPLVFQAYWELQDDLWSDEIHETARNAIDDVHLAEMVASPSRELFRPTKCLANYER